MAEKKKMSVADILAAARKTDGGGDGGDEPVASEPAASSETAAAETTAEAEAPAAESTEPAAKPKPATGASGGRPSVAEMLAMARGDKDGGAKKKAAPKAAAKKPADKKPAAAAKKPAASKPGAAEPRDTASILAAARKSSKAGPISKAEAAAKEKADPKGKAKAPIVVPPMPEKPAYAKPAKAAKKAKAGADDERRSFLWIGFAALSAFGGLWSLAALKFLFPNVRREPPSKFKVGFPDAYPAGQVQTKFKAQYGVWVSNAEYNGQQQIYALKSVCTHLGCTPSWLDAEQKFKCPCHGSGFYKDGINFEGPAPRPLERCAIRIADDGQIEIDKSRTFQEEMGQWEDSACYVPV